MKSRPSVIILDSNSNSREILESYINEIDSSFEVKAFDDYAKGIQEIEESEIKPIVFIDISELKDFDKNIETIKLSTPKIVVTSNDYSTDFIVRAMRYGAKEFLPKPIIKDDLKRIIEFITVFDTDENDSGSKIITIYSNKGGIGKTTVATNLAVELSKVTGDKVVLIDLNLQLGDVTTFLNIEPAFDVSYAIKNLISKKDETFMNVFEKYKNTNLYVLSDPNYIEESDSIMPYQLQELLEKLKKMFSYIVIDMSSNIDPNTLKILDLSDLILFTTIVNIPAIRNCQRCLNLFQSRKYSKDKVKILLNRYIEHDEIKVEDIENALGEKIYWKVPNNYFSIMEAINKGVPVSEISSNSNIANSFRDLATKIADDVVKQAVFKYRGN